MINYKNTFLGTWITLPSPSIAEIFVNSGFEWIVVDLEHSSISINQAEELIRVIDLGGKMPYVRVTSNSKNQIKRVLDAGAKGIIVPMVNTKKQAIKAIEATRYAPYGTRGVGLSRAQGYGEKFNEYLEWHRKNISIIVQFEHINVIENIDDILSLENIDGFIIGPYDLSCSMGIPGEFNNKKFIKTMKTILEKGKKHNCHMGIHIVEPNINTLKEKIIEGYNFIAFSVDIRMLSSIAKKPFENFEFLKK